jgi:hypothetical protein
LRTMVLAVGRQSCPRCPRPCRRLGMQSHDSFLPEPHPLPIDKGRIIPWQRQDRFASIR